VRRGGGDDAVSDQDDPPPRPALAAAPFALGDAPIERLPWWAAAWIADGLDGEALVELAGLSAQDRDAIRDLFPVAMDQLSIPLPSTAVASAVLVFDDLARRFLSGTAAPQWVVQRVGDVVWRCNDSPEVLALPLGRLYRALDDRWLVDAIVPQAELGLLVRRACVQQLHAIGRRGSERP
jgi:hypothetical protein